MPVIVRTSVPAVRFPQKCACCCGLVETFQLSGMSKTILSGEPRFWEIPYCFNCAKHVRGHYGLWFVIAAALLLLAGLIGAVNRTDGVFVLPVGGIFGALAIWEWSRWKKLFGDGCRAIHGRAARYLGWNGSNHVFTFENDSYASEFKEMNDP